jgi:2-dehydropantoate 2-reductase
LDEIAKPLLDAKFQVRTTEKIRDAIWSKLEGNAALSPVAALSNSIGTRLLIEDPLLRELTLGIIAETRAVGDKLGLAIDPFLGDTYARLSTMKPPMTDFRPSMLQDLERNRPIELNAISAATIEIADRVGVPVPLSKAVLGLLRSRVLSMGLPIT